MADEDNTNTPIQRKDLTLIEESESFMKKKFITEMKKMDHEINKPGSELLRLNTQSSTLHDETTTASESLERQSPSKVQNDWESLTGSTLVKGEGEDKIFKLQFVVGQFDPGEVTVKIENEKLIISATHEEKSDNRSVSRHFYRECKFPEGVDPSTANSTISEDGVLTIQAPMPQMIIKDKRER